MALYVKTKDDKTIKIPEELIQEIDYFKQQKDCCDIDSCVQKLGFSSFSLNFVIIYITYINKHKPKEVEEYNKNLFNCLNNKQIVEIVNICDYLNYNPLFELTKSFIANRVKLILANNDDVDSAKKIIQFFST